MGDTDEELQSRQFIFSLYAPHERHPSSPFTPDNERDMYISIPSLYYV